MKLKLPSLQPCLWRRTSRQLQLTVVSSEHLNCPEFHEILPKSSLVSKVSPFDFEFCVILIYILKVSDRAGDLQVTFSFHISCVGVSLFSLLKKC